ncbi:glutaminase [Klebsiella michiganensis]|uniref:glutaminase n=1 Tax=Klebsiella michiganensis TaxID=1134687 RepID=A0A7H4LX44_9ENTR|nr:glutaminase [Klebsiella michiganensis]
MRRKTKPDRWNNILNNLNAWADNSLSVNEPVFQSEMETNQHNQALAMLMNSYRSFYGDPQEAVEIYTRQCSVDITVEQLAKMGAVLANNGKSPFNGKQLLTASYVPQVLAEMAIAGCTTAAANGCTPSVSRQNPALAAEWSPSFPGNTLSPSTPLRWMQPATASAPSRPSSTSRMRRGPISF